MAPLPVPSFGRVNGFGLEATVGELVPLLALLVPEVKKLAYLEMAAAACWVVDEVPVVADDVDSWWTTLFSSEFGFALSTVSYIGD